MRTDETFQSYRKKPVEIKACRLGQENGGGIVQWICDGGAKAALRGGPGGGSKGGSVLIDTLEGTMQAEVPWDAATVFCNPPRPWGAAYARCGFSASGIRGSGSRCR